MVFLRRTRFKNGCGFSGARWGRVPGLPIVTKKSPPWFKAGSREVWKKGGNVVFVYTLTNMRGGGKMKWKNLIAL
jgi:hypothetical protein